MNFWSNKRITVTGGAGFLGSFVVEKLQEKECKEIFIPRSKNYDLVDMEAVNRLYRDSQPGHSHSFGCSGRRYWGKSC